MVFNDVSFDQDLVILQNWISSVQSQDFALISKRTNIKHFANKDITFKVKALLFLLVNSESEVKNIDYLKHLNVLDDRLKQEQLIDLVIELNLLDAFYALLKTSSSRIFQSLLSFEANRKFSTRLNTFEYLVSIAKRIASSKELDFESVDFLTEKIESFLVRNSGLLCGSMERFAATLQALQQIYQICFLSSISNPKSKNLLRILCTKILSSIESVIESNEFSEIKKDEIVLKYGLNIIQILGLTLGSLDALIGHENHNLYRHVVAESDVIKQLESLKFEELQQRMKSITNHYKILYVKSLLKKVEFYASDNFEVDLKELSSFLDPDAIIEIIEHSDFIIEENNITPILLYRMRRFSFSELIIILKRIVAIQFTKSKLKCLKESVVNAIRNNEISELLICFIQCPQETAKQFFGFVLTQKNVADQYSTMFSTIYEHVSEFDDFVRIFLQTFFELPSNLMSRSFSSFTNTFIRLNFNFYQLIFDNLQRKFFSNGNNPKYDFQIFVLFVQMFINCIKSSKQTYSFEDIGSKVCDILQYTYFSPESFDEEKVKVTDCIVRELKEIPRSRFTCSLQTRSKSIEKILESNNYSMLTKFRIMKLFGEDETPLFRFIAPKYAESVQAAKIISILLFTLPRCVLSEWTTIFDFLNDTLLNNELKTIAVIVDSLYIFSITFDFTNVCYQNCYRYCLVKFQNLLEKTEIEVMDGRLLNSIDRLVDVMPEMFRKTEGLVMLQKFMPINEFPLNMITKLKLTD